MIDWEYVTLPSCQVQRRAQCKLGRGSLSGNLRRTHFRFHHGLFLPIRQTCAFLSVSGLASRLWRCFIARRARTTDRRDADLRLGRDGFRFGFSECAWKWPVLRQYLQRERAFGDPSHADCYAWSRRGLCRMVGSLRRNEHLHCQRDWGHECGRDIRSSPDRPWRFDVCIERRCQWSGHRNLKSHWNQLRRNLHGELYDGYVRDAFCSAR